MVTTSSDKSLISPAARPAPLTGLSRVVTCLFVLLALLLQPAIAASTSTETQAAHPPQADKVIFEKGLLTVEANGVKLKALMGEISKKAGIDVSVSESLKEEKVIIHGKS